MKATLRWWLAVGMPVGLAAWAWALLTGSLTLLLPWRVAGYLLGLLCIAGWAVVLCWHPGVQTRRARIAAVLAMSALPAALGLFTLLGLCGALPLLDPVLFALQWLCAASTSWIDVLPGWRWGRADAYLWVTAATPLFTALGLLVLAWRLPRRVAPGSAVASGPPHATAA